MRKKLAMAVIGVMCALPAYCPIPGIARDFHNTAQCPTEDSVSCKWDAPHRGNGQGQSFYTYADGTRIYF